MSRGHNTVEVRDVVKRYQRGAVTALDGISFEAAAGEVFGLLGPNGAGKTTTVGILTTRVRPTAGQAFVDGVDVVRDPVQARARLAVVPQRSNLDRAISIRDNLMFHAAYHGVSVHERQTRADALLHQFELLQRANNKPDLFSGGQSQRVMIARALMHEPVVMFLDEPTTGLDPAARLFVWDRLRELKQRGVTLILTTHDMHEAAALTDRVAIIDRGKLLALDTPSALVQSLPGRATLELTIEPVDASDHAAVLETLRVLPGVEGLDSVDAAGRQHDGAAAGGHATGGAALRVRLYTSTDSPLLVAPASDALSSRGMRITDIKLGSPSLEDVFIHLTGRMLR